MPLLPERPYREQPGSSGRFARFARILGGGHVRPLREDELIIFEGMAYVLAGVESLRSWRRWIHKIVAPFGWLQLTDQRLIWMPHRSLPVIEVELADIVAVDRGRGGWLKRLWVFYLPLFRVDLRNGRTYLFQAPFGGTLRKAIAKAVGLPEGARGGAGDTGRRVMSDDDISNLRRLTRKDGSLASRQWLVETRGFDSDAADALVQSLVDDQTERAVAPGPVIAKLPVYGVFMYSFFWFALVVGGIGLTLLANILIGALLLLVGIAGVAFWFRTDVYRSLDRFGRICTWLLLGLVPLAHAIVATLY